MGRVVNRRGKQSRGARKKAFRSHDPELNPKWSAVPITGKNAPPKKTDGDVISTIANIKIREGENASDSTATAISQPSAPKAKLHDEQRKRGDEKRRLLESLKQKIGVVDKKETPKPEVLQAPETKVSRVADSAIESIFSGKLARAPVKTDSKKQGNKMVRLFENSSDIVKSTLHPSKPTVETKHSEHKRKKMRDRERAKREKERLKKEEKMEKRTKRFANAPKFNEVIDRPSESIRELGAQLAQKLAKESSSLQSAYDSIKKQRRD